MLLRRKIKAVLREHLSESIGELLTARIMERTKTEFESDYKHKNGRPPGKSQWSAFWEEQIQSGEIIKGRNDLLDEITDKTIARIGTFHFIKNDILNLLPAFWIIPMSHYAVRAWGKYLGKEDPFSDVGLIDVASSSLAVITLVVVFIYGWMREHK